MLGEKQTTQLTTLKSCLLSTTSFEEKRREFYRRIEISEGFAQADNFLKLEVYTKNNKSVTEP